MINYVSRTSTRVTAFQVSRKNLGVLKVLKKKKKKKRGALDMCLLSSTLSVWYTFSEEEEQALICVCIVYLRQSTPLTIDSLVDIVSLFAGRDDEHRLSPSSFCYSFLERHKSEISYKPRKLTSLTRFLDIMLQMTNEFIALF